MGIKGVPNVNLHDDRIGEEEYNYQGCLMKIVEYNASRDITVEFQDDNRGLVHTQYYNFKHKQVKNPYYPLVHGVGMVGNKYPARVNGVQLKEYRAWTSMLCRCYNDNFKLKKPTYKDVTCCNEWLIYDNFYEWIHGQENFDKWLNGNKWELDKDILVKGNKIYSPSTCCLVPRSINLLFVKSDKRRGNLPIGVSYNKENKAYMLSISRKIHDFPPIYLDTPEEVFKVYKEYKENVIKQVAQKEFNLGNITKVCYDAMMKYEVEIGD